MPEKITVQLISYSAIWVWWCEVESVVLTAWGINVGIGQCRRNYHRSFGDGRKIAIVIYFLEHLFKFCNNKIKQSPFVSLYAFFSLISYIPVSFCSVLAFWSVLDFFSNVTHQMNLRVSVQGMKIHVKIVSFIRRLRSAYCAYFAQTIIRFPKMFLPIGSNFLPVQSKENHFLIENFYF